MLLKNVRMTFDRPFDKLTVPSEVEGLMALSEAEGQGNRRSEEGG